MVRSFENAAEEILAELVRDPVTKAAGQDRSALVLEILEFLEKSILDEELRIALRTR